MIKATIYWSILFIVSFWHPIGIGNICIILIRQRYKSPDWNLIPLFNSRGLIAQACFYNNIFICTYFYFFVSLLSFFRLCLNLFLSHSTTSSTPHSPSWPWACLTRSQFNKVLRTCNLHFFHTHVNFTNIHSKFATKD